MGFLVDSGATFTYEESKIIQQFIKEQGIIQFLKLYKENYNKILSPEQFTWGDEIEFQIVNFDDSKKEVKLQLNTQYIFDKFQNYIFPNPIFNSEQQIEIMKNQINFETKYEYGQWMVEAVPDKPFYSLCNLDYVYQNIKSRRVEIQKSLQGNDYIFSISAFPLLGVNKNFFVPRENNINNSIEIETNSEDTNQEIQENSSQQSHSFEKEQEDTTNKFNQYSESLYSNDEIITEHRRFKTLTHNIRQRRQEKVDISIPIFQDKFTAKQPTQDEPYPGQIYMDAMTFGMGNSCVQVTFSTQNVHHARILYDQLAIISPLFIALSASSPIFKGKLADIDSRWDIISKSVDCRNKEERDPASQKYIPKSRYSSISYYIADKTHKCDLENCGCKDKITEFKDEYNDLKFPINQDIINFIKEKQKEFDLVLDENLIQHLGFMFIRDALVIFKNKVDNIDENSTEHFENIQSTNWNSVRFKPPPQLNSTMPWRVEFRTLEIQLTEEENTLFTFLVLKIANLFYSNEFKLNFYIPISYVDENFKRSQQRNAILDQKFFFRKNVFDNKSAEIVEITLKEFFFGSNQFIGMKKIFDLYYTQQNQNKEQYHCKANKGCNCIKEIERIFEFVRDKVEGKKLTVASWIRQFVQNHPSYKQDSIVTQEIAYDLLNRIKNIQNHTQPDPNFVCEQNWSI